MSYSKNNLINGNGAMVWIETHEKYTGQWVNNLQNGFGIHTWFESSTNSRGFRNRYVGEWKEGTKHGYGVFFYSDGSKYEGYWENDEKHGFGVFTFKNGTQYIGKFVHDRMFDFNSEGIVEISKGTILDTNTFERTTTLGAQMNIGVKKGMKVKLPKIESNKKPPQEMKKSSGLEVIMEKHNEATPMKVGAINSGSLNEETKTNKRLRVSTNNTQTSNKFNRKKTNDNDRELNSVYIASNRIIKATDTNQFKTMIDITDIIDTQLNTEQTEKEVENSLQRNMTEIRTWYFKLLKVELQEQDNFFMISRVQTNNNINIEDELNLKYDDDINPPIESLPLNSQSPPPNIISPINPNSQNLLNDNKIGTYLELRDVWKLFRDFGIISPELTIAKLNRNFYKNPKNSVEMFLFPNVTDKTKQYTLVYEMISKAIDNFKNKHESYLQLEQKLLQTPKSHTGIKLPKDDENSPQQIDSSVYYQEEDLEKIRIEFDFHQPRNVITLKQFYEIVVRAAYIKFFYLDISLDKKIELLVSKCKMKPKEKKSEQTSKDKDKEQTDNQVSSQSKTFGKNILMQGLMNDISNRMLGGNFNNVISQQNQLTLEQKQRNAEHTLIDAFINKHEETLYPIFNKLCYYQREQNCLNEDCNDHTITHRFLFYNLIKHSSLLKQIYGTKAQYVDLITYYFKERQTIFDNKKEEFDYYEMLLDLELVFFEFCEMVYIMTQKYINEVLLSKNKMKKDDNEEEVNYKEQESNVNDNEKINEEEQNVLIIKHIQNIILTSHNFSQRKDVKYAKQKYTFPERAVHKQLDKEINEKIEKDHSRLLKRYEKIRFTNERKMFMEEEKINAFIPPQGMDNDAGEYEEEEVADY